MRNANDVAGSEERLSRSRSFLLLFPYACVRSRRGKYEVASRPPREAKRSRMQGTRNSSTLFNSLPDLLTTVGATPCRQFFIAVFLRRSDTRRHIARCPQREIPRINPYPRPGNPRPSCNKSSVRTYVISIIDINPALLSPLEFQSFSTRRRTERPPFVIGNVVLLRSPLRGWQFRVASAHAILFPQNSIGQFSMDISELLGDIQRDVSLIES